MIRREFLGVVVTGGTLALAAVAGLGLPVIRASGRAGRILARVPANMLGAIRKRTRALDAADLERPHDLAG